MLAAIVNTGALRVEELLGDPELTPKKFAGLFENFEYEFHDEVQKPEQFLASRKGDCDDYAILASRVLRPRHYQTRLIHVRLMGQLAHVVCYVTEAHAYLDYNDRKFFFKLTSAPNRIRAIADKVADSLDANWTSASEFTYDYATETKTITRTVVKLEPPEQDPDAADRHD